jgi:glycine/D-amino acid oxidase-like deaminating enzyme/nitrite reductase/ring-hydroxylating ferredoxin subunit
MTGSAKQSRAAHAVGLDCFVAEFIIGPAKRPDPLAPRNDAFERTTTIMGNSSDLRSKSLWMDIEVAPDARPLDGDQTCDVVIAGSGIAGISTAYELAVKGLQVMIVDRGRIAGGITARTSAHLAPLCDDLTSEMIKLRGEETSRKFYESQAAAVDRIEAIQKRENIDCDFRRLDGYLFQALNTDSQIIDNELDAVRKVGAPVHRLVGVPLDHCDKQHVLRYPCQATFHPLKYLKGLAEIIAAKGGMFYSGTIVQEIEERKDGSVAAKTDSGVITAKAAVVATNSPIIDTLALHTKMAPYRTYAMAFAIKRGAIPDALYWDTLDPYHYVRLQPGEGATDTLIVGGADHKSGEADDADIRFDALEAWARNLIPAAKDVTHRWSGQVLDTIDYAAFIGRNPGNQNIYVHTGDSGQGMTHGVVGSLINSALILGDTPKRQEVYEPTRKTPSGIGNFLRENVTAIKNFAEYLAPGELKSSDDLKPGHGAIVRQGLSKIAAYRDKDGALHTRSAACTHIGCHLHWNSFETCWDCPCHGSQFAVDGTVLNAPAISALADVKAGD